MKRVSRLACWPVSRSSHHTLSTGKLANRPTGFSLVELVIAMAILGVGLVGSMRVFPVGLRASQRAEMNSRAAIAAQRVIESLKLKPWGELGEAQATTETVDGFEVTTAFTHPVLAVPLVDPDRLTSVEVTVRWVQDTRPHELTFVTYLRRNVS